LYTIHKLGATFIVRAKKNVRDKRLSWKRTLQNNVLSDSKITFIGFYPKDYYPEPLRLVRYWDEENKREFIFLTNNFDLTALQVAELYRQRWQIELFFKWFKQHLKIKHFYGTSLNAVKIQVFVAIITFCLVAIVQHDMKLELSTYQVLHILSTSLTNKMHLVDLLNKTNFQNDKEHFDSSEQLLFDLNF
jgi:IS4 transposase